MCSYESRETFTEHQVEKMSAAITNAVDEVILEQCSVIESRIDEPERTRNMDNQCTSPL